MGHILILMLAPFAFATGAYVFSGLLGPMSADVGVSVAAAAQLQTAFTIACAVGGPLLAIATARLDRRKLLLGVLVFLAVANALSALTQGFGMLMGVRIAAGFIGALTLPVASAMAVMLVAPERRAVALAAILAGNSLAFLVGIPVGSFIGASFGWASSFWFAAALCLGVAILILVRIPATDAPPRPPKDAMRTALRWPLTGLMGVTLLAFTATFSTVGLIGPVVTASTGLTGAAIGWMQALIGIGSIFGLAVGARLASSAERPLPMLVAGILVTQVIFGYAILFPAPGPVGVAMIGVAIAVGAACLFACAPVIQTRLGAGAGPSATIAFAFNGSMIFLGQGLGTAIGGAATSLLGLWSVGVSGAVVAVFGVLLATRNLTISGSSRV
ncbi:MAG: MFS transporter [Pseudomonadota bacterium]